MPKRRRTPPAPPTAFEQVDVSPLIDVSFLLLIFFLVTSVVQKGETDLAMTLPNQGPPPPGIAPLTIDIQADASGTVRCDGRTVATDPNDHRLPLLVAELEQTKSLAHLSETFMMASIDIADDATQQRFADLLNALSTAGIEHINIRGEP